MIEIRGLTKRFCPTQSLGAWLRAPWRRGQPITALDRVSLAVQPGEVVCVMGSNGAGKTTLLKILAGLVLPTSGSVTINGLEIRSYDRSMRAQMGFAPGERPGFYDRLTGRQNLEFYAALHGASRAESRRRVDALLEWLAVDRPDQRYQEYSTGMKQRVNLARALFHEPRLLLLDEPTKSLDPVQTARFHDFLKEWVRGGADRTVVLTTHHVAEAEQLADAVAILHRGAVRYRGVIDRFKQEIAAGMNLERLCRDDARLA